MLSHFHLIPERYGRTDRQTDTFAISKNAKVMIQNPYAGPNQISTKS